MAITTQISLTREQLIVLANALDCVHIQNQTAEQLAAGDRLAELLDTALDDVDALENVQRMAELTITV